MNLSVLSHIRASFESRKTKRLSNANGARSISTNSRSILLLASVLGTLNIAHGSLSNYSPTDVPEVIDLQAIDESVSPCDNFYQYACGSWLKALDLPKDKSVYYHQFTALDDHNTKMLSDVLANTDSTTKISLLYNSCMQNANGQQSNKLIEKQMRRAETIKNLDQLANFVASLHLQGVSALFSFYPAQDLKDSSRMIGYLSQGGFSLPEKSYYFQMDQQTLKTQHEFINHISRMLGLWDKKKAMIETTDAMRVYNLERRLAKVSLSLADQMDPEKTYDLVSVESVEKTTPSFNWNNYLKFLQVTENTKQISLTPKEYFVELEKVLKNTDWATIHAYLKYHILHHYAPTMGSSFDDENFSFWGKHLQGKVVQEERYKRCVSLVESDLRDDLAQKYVESFPNAQKMRSVATDILVSVKQSFSTDVQNLDWLDDATKTAAQEKLSMVGNKIGYPNQWVDYSSIQMLAGELLYNDAVATVFESRRQLAKLGKPVDRNEFGMPPWELNAYYDPSMNEMVFPLANLQRPLLDLTATIPGNMGALGATMGHELTHGFDVSGSKMDGHGNLRDWWSTSTKENFKVRTQCLVNQADQYEILPGLKVRGEQTLTENIADQGGTKLAYMSYLKMAEKNPVPQVGKYNAEQQFFLSYAQSWCAKSSDERIRSLVQSNEHPPEEFRVNAVLYNLPQFAKAYSCRDGVDKMAPKNRCSAW